ncbi:ATPase family AAA domain-containing protein 5 isoform X2 [Sphaeramia orbicularis]|uniref:ATPase family AAA domain-containing protein 5 isoform X2 n=1 Tax=Sphaeramia orbicularis TaxID=375764 RepID=UPI0011807045|nr:ATPase family AAA domain-containing protein 5-like isoform X2 [Sphaeramia orbicularis]
MAGVVAMASVIEDFDTQPCKKARKDGGSPVVKTITNYFSPLPKPVEKPFSPPRSNNIMDYFSRKAPSSKEKISSPEQSKENCQTEKRNSPEVAVKRLAQKRGRKASKIARKLVEADTVISTQDDSCFIVEPQDGRESAAAEANSSSTVLGSDTAVLLGQLCAESCITTAISEKNTALTEHADQKGKDQNCFKGGNHIKPKQDLSSKNLSPVLPSKDKVKRMKTTARNARKKQQQETKQSEPEEKESENSLCDVSMEVNVDETSQLNKSTVTISFEDFVRSHSQDESEEALQDEEGKGDESKITTEAEEKDTDQLRVPEAEENFSSGEPSIQISPRTVTVQAEVHVVSPKEEPVKAVGKVASIFTRRKGASSPQTETGHQLSPSSLNAKRKSNVVLQEGDLELAVLESESTPKCSEVERKQFMAAFKQPSLDGSKTKPVKSQGKQKQAGEKTVDTTEKANEDDVTVLPSSEKITASSQENKVAKKKPARKGRKMAKEEKEEATTLPAAAPEEGTVVIVEEVDKKDLPITSTPSMPAVRRSTREAVVRQTSKPEPKTPTRRQDRSKDAAPLTQDSTLEISTSKRHKSRHGVFKAEVVCPPDRKESPIRIKFTRVHKNITVSKAEGGVSKMTKDSKKAKQAKKLVEKAKAIQQSKKTSVTEKRTLRRSSRTEASLKKSYCENEDSVICLEEEEDQTETPQMRPEKSKTRKALRSLNDVLGKTTPACKDVKAPPGSKMCQEKTARKSSVVVSIFDESSHEGSENSQDDEQFRARREFLKSGLPESFRKQIAKTAATKEAYTLSCSSFQPAVHMNQPPKDCPFWSLPWPDSSLLCHLKELWCQISNPPSLVTKSFSLKMAPARQACCQRGSGWRPEISESVRQLLMEEVNAFNPPFPAQKFIISFLKRRSDQHCTASELQAATNVSSTPVPAEAVGGKRKRKDDNGEITGKMAKKQRATRSGEKVCQPEAAAEPTKREGRTRRGQKPVLKEEEVKKGAKPSIKRAPIPSEDDSVIVVDDLLVGQDAEKQDVVKEDVLWTDKYQPQHSSEIIGNTASVKRLHSWLKEWKLRADKEDRKKQKERKQEEGSIDSDWDCGEDDSQDGEDLLCNTILITGPTGVGKTAAVYACAQELGFKVFEVNASSQRSGRLILSQLKEATQSHQVDSQGINAHKPTYFNSYSMSSSTGSVRAGSSPRKVNSPRRVVSSPRKPQSPRGGKKGALAPTSLANFFKMGQPANKEAPNIKKNEQKADSKKITKSNEAVSKRKDPAVKSPTATTAKEKSNEEQSKKTATSLILFEEVDVIFEDDSGFLAAIKTFMSTTKRPVILTTSDPNFSTMFDGNFEEIHFRTPSVLNVGTYLQLLCLAEDMRTDLKDIKSLLSLNGCDIRKSLLQLQFWTRSAGGEHITRPLAHSSENEVKTDKVTSTLPPCDSGCTESMLGLLNIEPAVDIWELLKSQSLVEDAVCWRLLTASKQRGVDLIYSNMEKLLPLPLTQLTISVHKPEQFVPDSQDQPSVHPQEPQSDKLPSHGRLLNTGDSDCSDDASPVKVSNRMRKSKKRHRLFDQDKLQSDSDSEDGFLSLCQQKGLPHVPEKVKESLVSEKVKRKPLTPQEQVKSVPISQCLQSIADFLDDMSYMDSSLLHSEGDDIHRGMIPTGAMVKDGLSDESRVESSRGNWMTGECVLEIQAAVEALSFSKCRLAVTDTWEKVQQLDEELRKDSAAEMSLPMAPHREGYSFTQDSPCQPQVVQRRMEVMEDLMLKGVFGTVGNRPAAALDYLPALRTICRSEQLKEQGKVKRRFLHYLDAIHLGLQKTSLQHLAEDFP